MGQSEIDQHRFARGTEHDAARLDVVMDDVLAVQVGKGVRDLDPDDPRFFIRDRQIVEPLVERLARNALQHDIGLACEIAGTETGGHVRPGQSRQDHLLHLEADDGRRILAFGDPRDLHQHGDGDAGMGHRPQRRHAAAMDALADREAIEHRAGLDRKLRHSLTAPRTGDRPTDAAGRFRECDQPPPRCRRARGNR